MAEQGDEKKGGLRPLSATCNKSCDLGDADCLIGEQGRTGRGRCCVQEDGGERGACGTEDGWSNVPRLLSRGSTNFRTV